MCKKQNYSHIGILAKKDLHLRIIDFNEALLFYSGYEESQVYNMTDYNFPWAKYADLYRQHDLDALTGNNYTALMPLVDCENNEMVFAHYKEAIFDDKGVVVGLFWQSFEVLYKNVQDIILTNHLCEASHQQVRQLFKDDFSAILSEMEILCLYYLMRGKSVKCIAYYLKKSTKTIEKHILSMRLKFNCNSVNALIENAFERGFAEIRLTDAY